jgi:hypothetical protein
MESKQIFDTSNWGNAAIFRFRTLQRKTQWRVEKINNVYNINRKRKMKSFRIKMRKVATIVACLAVTMMTACGGGSNKQSDGTSFVETVCRAFRNPQSV